MSKMQKYYPFGAAMQSISDILFDYLEGQPISSIKTNLRELCAKNKKNAKSIYKETPCDRAFIEQLMHYFAVPKHHREAYFKQTHHLAILERLHKQGYDQGQLYWFLLMVHHTEHLPYTFFKIFSGCLVVSAGLGTYVYLNTTYCLDLYERLIQNLPSSLISSIEILKKLPIIGLGYQVFIYLLFLYHGLYDGLFDTPSQIATFIFQTMTTACMITGYSLIWVAHGVPSPLSAACFILSAFIQVIASIGTYYVLIYHPLEKDDLASHENLRNIQNLRLDAEKKTAFQIMVARCIFSLIAVSLVCVWSLTPPGMLLNLICFSLFIIHALCEKIILHQIYNHNVVEQQTKLQALPKFFNRRDHNGLKHDLPDDGSIQRAMAPQ